MTKPAFNKAMGARLDSLRKSQGLTYKDLGGRLGVTYQQIQKYIKGINAVPIAKLSVLAEMFGIPVSSLLEQGDKPAAIRTATAAENDAFLAARYIARIADAELRRNLVDFTRKLAYQGGAAA